MRWGAGPVLVVPPGWISHLELQWHDLGMRDFYERLAERYELVFYDKRGMGLSEREREDFSLADELADLEVVIDEVTQGTDRAVRRLAGRSAVDRVCRRAPRPRDPPRAVWRVRHRRATSRRPPVRELADRACPRELGSRRRGDGVDLRPRASSTRRSTPSCGASSARPRPGPWRRTCSKRCYAWDVSDARGPRPRADARDPPPRRPRDSRAGSASSSPSRHPGRAAGARRRRHPLPVARRLGVDRGARRELRAAPAAGAARSAIAAPEPCASVAALRDPPLRGRRCARAATVPHRPGADRRARRSVRAADRAACFACRPRVSRRPAQARPRRQRRRRAAV